MIEYISRNKKIYYLTENIFQFSFISAAVVLISPLIFLVCVSAYAELFGEANKNLASINKQFHNIQAYDSSELIFKDQFVGNFTGTSKHCDYFVGEIRRSIDSTEDIENYYKKKKILVPNRATETALVPLKVIFFDQRIESQLNNLPPYVKNKVKTWMENDLVQKKFKNRQAFLVYSLASGPYYNWDFRC